MFQMKIAFVLLPLLAQLCSCKTLRSSDGELLKSLFTKDRLEQFRDVLAEAMDPYVFPEDKSFFMQPDRNLLLRLTLLEGTEIRGLSKLFFEDVEVHEDIMTVSLGVSVPSIQVDGEYDVKARHGDVHLILNGEMLMTVESPRGTIHLTIDRSRDGSYLEAKEVKIIDMRIGEVDISLIDNEATEKMVKNFLHGKTDSLFEEQIKSRLQPKLEDILHTLFNLFLKQTP